MLLSRNKEDSFSLLYTLTVLYTLYHVANSTWHTYCCWYNEIGTDNGLCIVLILKCVQVMIVTPVHDCFALRFARAYILT